MEARLNVVQDPTRAAGISAAAAPFPESAALAADFRAGALTAAETRRRGEQQLLAVLQQRCPAPARRQLCHLLRVAEEGVQRNAANLLRAYFWISMLAYDVRADQLPPILAVEQEVSAAIAWHLGNQ